MENQTQMLYTLTQISEILNVPVSWLYERSRHDALPGLVRLGKYVRINEEGLRELMSANNQPDDQQGDDTGGVR